MDVFVKYFRRLLQANASVIFPNGRSNDSAASYPILLTEVFKLASDPAQPGKIAEALDAPEGELFRDFNLSGFVDHFKLDPVVTTFLLVAVKGGSRADLRSKGEF